MTQTGPERPHRAAIDFDHHSEDYARGWRATNAELQRQCPVAWSESYGGFWLVTRYQDVLRVATDNVAFSQDNDVEGVRKKAKGVSIPRSPLRMLPVECDPPLALEIRRLLMPHFDPAAARGLSARMRGYVTELIDEVVVSGDIEFVADLLMVAPMKLNLSFIGFGQDEWRAIARTSRALFATPADSPDFPSVVDEVGRLSAGIVAAIEDRRMNPRDDVISTLVHGRIGGERVSDQDALAVLMSLVFGGSDTTGTLTASALGWLDEHPEHRQQLATNPALMETATDEFLRYYPPNHTLSRTAVEDVEIGGQHICKGEQVLMSWAAANRDPSVFERPDDLMLHRAPNRQASFGLGIHHCLGSHIARMEFGVMLTEVLLRMPDYRIDWARTKRFSNVGTLCGYLALPATFTPGVRHRSLAARPGSSGVH
jgi:cytochrome P450